MSYKPYKTTGEIIEAFIEGNTAYSATLTAIPLTDDGRLILVHRGNQVLAVRHENGRIVIFTGWKSAHNIVAQIRPHANDEQKRQLEVPYAILAYGPSIIEDT